MVEWRRMQKTCTYAPEITSKTIQTPRIDLRSAEARSLQMMEEFGAFLRSTRRRQQPRGTVPARRLAVGAGESERQPFQPILQSEPGSDAASPYRETAAGTRSIVDADDR